MHRYRTHKAVRRSGTSGRQRQGRTSQGLGGRHKAQGEPGHQHQGTSMDDITGLGGTATVGRQGSSKAGAKGCSRRRCRLGQAGQSWAGQRPTLGSMVRSCSVSAVRSGLQLTPLFSEALLCSGWRNTGRESWASQVPRLAGRTTLTAPHTPFVCCHMVYNIYIY